MQLVRTGSLVMWNVEDSFDDGCMGLVVHSKYIDYTETDEDIVHYFYVRWADETHVEYDHEEIKAGKIKVVKF